MLFLQSGAEHFALPAAAVTEVVPAVPLHRPAGDANPALAGVFRYRGAVVPVFALGTPGAERLSARIVVVEFPGDPPQRLGLLADRVSELKPLVWTGLYFTPPTEPGCPNLGMLVAVPGGLVRVLDPAALRASLAESVLGSVWRGSYAPAP